MGRSSTVEDVLEAPHMTYPPNHVDGLSITVLGAARSGVAAARLLVSKQAAVFVSDQAPASSLAASVDVLTHAGIPLETGEHTERAFACDLMVVSPGIASDAPVVLEAQRRGIDVVSELECASWFCAGPIAAITGSNGKTTTTALIGRMLEDDRVKHVVGGNIGTAFSSILPGLEPDAISVLEVSSFQLDHIRSFRPGVAVLLNITPDHMDRYGHSLERYAASKARIGMNQTDRDLLLYNADDEQAADIASHSKAVTLPFSVHRTLDAGAWIEEGNLVSTGSGTKRKIIPVKEISVRGMHNAANAMAAVLTAQHFGVRDASIRATLRNFKGVEHRLEYVGTVRGIQYINDSKATNVDSVAVALESFSDPVVLILGGRDKGNDYSTMRELVREHVRSIVAIGESADTVAEAFLPVVHVQKAISMEGAVRAATALASVGDVVLLSPACASFDWFRDYEHRGEAFKEAVRAL